jgi:hypothetical protein
MAMGVLGNAGDAIIDVSSVLAMGMTLDWSETVKRGYTPTEASIE